jgi:hypothetical protein
MKARKNYPLVRKKFNLRVSKKKNILKGYDLVIEDYRQKFGNCKKLDDQNNVEFAREKELLFEKWLTSQEVTKMFNKLSYNVINPFDEFKQ